MINNPAWSWPDNRWISEESPGSNGNDAR